MYLKYSAGFLIASTIQALIIMTTELFGLTNLDVNFSFMQLLTHVLVGQVIGYILLITIGKIDVVRKYNVWVIGSITGLFAWIILLSINSTLGNVNSPWSEGFSTILFSMIAFIVFGIIITYTIKKLGYENN